MLLSDGELSSGDLVLISIAFWIKVFIEAESMNRHAAKTFVSIGLLIDGIGLNPFFQVTCFAQTPDTASPSSASVHGSKSGPKLSKAQKIALAMSAGPAEITKNATLADMTEMSGGPPKELRAGTNGSGLLRGCKPADVSRQGMAKVGCSLDEQRPSPNRGDRH